MRRYHVTTFGCQMNAHDSERIKGMLESLGLGEARSQDIADVIVFNTCTVREKPDQRFAAHLAQARALKARDPEKVIAVGGCYAEAQREHIFELLEAEVERARARGAGDETEAALRHLAGVLLHTPSVRARELAADGRLQEFTAALDALYGVKAKPRAEGAENAESA